LHSTDASFSNSCRAAVPISSSPTCPFRTFGEEVAIERLKAGATDYVLKNWVEKLPAVVRRAVREMQDQNTRDIPVVVLSADATVSQNRRLIASGAAAYLTKPLDVSHLLAVLDERFS
jgi:CheY-like chemotaxis protein